MRTLATKQPINNFVKPKNGDRGRSRSVSPLSTGMPLLQRQCACGGGCPRCQDELGIQTKLKISEPGDHYEQEADRIADEVMRMPESKVQPILTSNIQRLHDSGQPLPRSVRSFFEPRFGYDFSQVRVHTDAKAAKVAQAINARAFTLGQDVVFGLGQYAPGTLAGQQLLAHELVHTLQQTGESLTAVIQRTIGDGHDLTAEHLAGDEVLEAVYDEEQLLQIGSRGTAVLKLQQALIDAGLSLPQFGVDGIFGAETKAAVEDFQRASGLGDDEVDGIVGPITMGWLDQRFADRPAPTGSGEGPTSGCSTTKTATIDIVSLHGSNRDAIADLEFANTVFNQCCVRFVLGTGASATEAQTRTWLGGDTDLQRIHSCSDAHQEERDLRENVTVEFGLNSRYKVFYIESMTPRLNGVNFSPDCSSGDRAPFNRHLYISNSANRRTLAHEIGHIPISGLSDHTTHGGGPDNLMIPNGPGSKLTAAQCTEVFNNV
ncbi:MAG TPA: hypothetical protein DCY91_09400 [Cyanobacteria bacterium UBA11370]|nr:hypothetical protein [Cyanobacteria bacterium UBA11370]